jgi:hypothetical protein
MRDGASSSGVRWRDDVGFEMRCEDCLASAKGQCFWPITLEFWNPERTTEKGTRAGRGMTRCRACWRERDAYLFRTRYSKRPSIREKNRLRNEQYRAENRDVIRAKNRAWRRDARERKAA